jgi:hypothetical protein
MQRLQYRSAYASVRAAGLAGRVLAVGLLVAGEVSADAPAEPDLRASMQCDRAGEPGRVRCTVEARVVAGMTLTWADVVMLALPDFASPLKGRIGPQDALSRDPTSTKWALGLVARRAGQGEVRARVRAVVCDAPSAGEGGAGALPMSPAPARRCVPVTVDVKAGVTVGG